MDIEYGRPFTGRKLEQVREFLRKSELDYDTGVQFTVVVWEGDEIIATGYNGAPRGRKNCVDLNYCTREAMNIPSGQRYELCRSVHAEANCIISAARKETLDSTLYMACRNPATGELIPGSTSCSMCRRQIINAGIRRVVIRDTPTEYRVVEVQEWIDDDDSLPENL